MDKNRMKHDKKRIAVHPNPKNVMQSVHKAYGLIIFGGCTGTASAPDSFSGCVPRYFEHYSISHLLEGAGRLWLENGEETDVHPGDAVVITPGTVNRYGGVNGQPYVEDSLIFFGPVADMMKKAGVIRDGVFPFGRVRRLPAILRLIGDPAHASQIRANMELQKLLVELYLDSLEPASGCPAFEQLLSDIKSDPSRWWTVSEMAEQCGLSDDQLRRVFVKYTGCHPKLYLDRLKLRHAGEMLMMTHRSVGEIAKSLGYLDPYHFSRRFKTVMGLSPQQYRRTAALRH